MKETVNNRYYKKGYKTGEMYILGLFKIAENDFDGDIEKALNHALEDIEKNGAHEHKLPTEEAFRWIKDQEKDNS